MLYLCDKCGARTRWYDEKCPRCGATQTVEIPTAPIVLPSFASSPTRRDEEIAVVLPFSPTTQPKEETSNPAQTTQPKEETANPAQTTQPKEETSNPTERSQRLTAVRRAVDVWRSVFVSETSSVTLPRGRAARYALGIVVELFVCPPCALLAVYFLTRALLADRRANYHEAMLETEKARRSLAVGLGVFAAFLCAFILYVQSQEIAAPSEKGPNTRLFNR